MSHNVYAAKREGLSQGHTSDEASTRQVNRALPCGFRTKRFFNFRNRQTVHYVVASVHSAFNLSESEMTQRVIRALENPFVTMLAHPTGRLLLKRDPYQIDIPAVLDAAARTGTWIELNAAPKRLDLDWRWWPLAKQKGVNCVINPDAHRTERLQDLWFGIGIARKGWLNKDDVVNCLPIAKIEKALRAKSAR